MFRRRASDSSGGKPVSLLVVGLGNPGPGYHGTRHNVGAVLAERLAARMGVSLKRSKQARVAAGEHEDHGLMVAVPTTFMNDSGKTVNALVRSAGVKPPQLLVAHDELDFTFARVRLKQGGGTAGHNGLRSIEASLRSREFLRLRIGIGRPPPGVDPVDHVLTKFRPEEREPIDAAIEKGIDGLCVYLRDGFDAAQNFLGNR